MPLGQCNVFVSSPEYGAVYNDKVTVSGNMIYDVDVHASVVHGHVIDAQTSAPIPDAQIIFQPLDRASPVISARATTTDFSGRFTSDLVQERKWRVRVQRDKYEATSIDVDVVPGMPEIEIPKLEKGDEYLVPPNKQAKVVGVPRFSPLEMIAEQITSPENPKRLL